jgi:hypothetical protein
MFQHTSLTRTALVLPAVALLAVGCGDDDSTSAGRDPSSSVTTAPPVIDTGDGGDYQPEVDPADFVDTVDNPYFPLTPGTRWVYEGLGDEGENERVEVVVTDERRDVMGISAVVVQDTQYADGALVEDTFDWYAQDRDGNVWYLGEDTREYEDGEVVSTTGSWEAGVDGALPGIVMPTDPQVGDAYRQEYYAGEAEDMAEVAEVGASHSVAVGDYDEVLITDDWTPLEPEVVERKYYAPGVGVIAEEKTQGGQGDAELIEFTPAA